MEPNEITGFGGGLSEEGALTSGLEAVLRRLGSEKRLFRLVRWAHIRETL